MDLHLTTAKANAEEMSAVDAVLGKPHEEWPRQTRAMESGNGAGSHGAGARSQRDLLLPVLHAIQERMGWISPGALNYAASRLHVAPAEVYGVASFYGMFSLVARPMVTAHVCDDIACLTQGAGALCGELERKLGPSGSPCLNGKASWQRSACLGLCERAPAALVTVAGKSPKENVVAPANAETISSTLEAAVHGNLGGEGKEGGVATVPQSAEKHLQLLRRVGKVNPESFEDYARTGGYQALRRAFEWGPERVIREVIESNLVGRGGAAFPTGKKWEAVHAQRGQGRPCFVVCNADESEPGTFKDRVVMEGDPFSVLEGMTIAAFAVGAHKGYIYLRGEYPLAAERMAHAMRAARAAGALGGSILGSGFAFDVELRRGAGAYVCGEETALFNSIEGYRGEPRNKPPFPTQAGLFREPTVVNNVETLINVPEIVLNGGAAYAAIGTADSKGRRLFCVSGHVKSPGVYELVFGPTIAELIEMAGGVAGSGRLQAVLLGGAAGSFVSPAELNTPLTFEGVRSIGATLGSGVLMLFDDTVDLRAVLLRIAEFFRSETCGQCVPCRVGTMRQEESLQRLARRAPIGSLEEEKRLLQEMAQAMRDASICGLGQTASSAILSAMNRWSLFS